MNTKQREAVEVFGKDILVNAGAGSGKTTVLVERFVHAVTEQGVAPDRILAVTFTDLAANHMKCKLIERFAALGREEDRRALEGAYIGTIHSFCMRLLRENPIEAAVDPYFKVLSKPEADILMAKAMDAAFEAQGERPLWIDFLVEREEKQLREALSRLYAHFRATGEDERLLEIKKSADRKSFETKIRRLFEEIAVSLQKKDKLGKSEAAALEASAYAGKIFCGKKIDTEIFEEARKIERSIKQQGSEFFQEWVLSFKKILGLWKAAALQDFSAPLKEEFLRTFQFFRENYESQKRTAAVFDFDDLVILACRLLEGESPGKKAVRARYREHFRHLLVDEFQDTSPLQARLIDLLRREGNLFTVGDKQQSIYSFRQADPALFAKYEDSAGRKIILDENYRSRPKVLDFVNGFFEKEAAGAFGKLLAGKKFKLQGEGAVEILPAFYGEDEELKKLEEAREKEAAMLAGRLNALVREKIKVEGPLPSGRPLEWGDIAVLLRSSTPMPVYERAFSRAGIPFYSPKSDRKSVV